MSCCWSLILQPLVQMARDPGYLPETDPVSVEAGKVLDETSHGQYSNCPHFCSNAFAYGVPVLGISGHICHCWSSGNDELRFAGV